MDPLTVELARAILDQANSVNQAAIFEGNTTKDRNVEIVTLDLTTARLETNPYSVGFSFKSFIVKAATDSSTTVYMKLNDQGTGEGIITLNKNDAVNMDEAASRAFLHWDAQSGKSVTIIFFKRAQFTSGSLIQQTAGGVSVSDGTAVAAQAVASVTSTAASLFASDSSRIKMQICNYGGSSIYLGDSAVTGRAGAKPGIEVPPGAQYSWENSAQCYAITDGVTNAAIGLVKFS
jgi:hypothetical protein